VIRRRALVHGRVQGVFFRDTTRRVANANAVAGSAANRTDGTVEIILEGDPDAVEAVLAFCRQGPEGAAVSRVEVFDEEPAGLQGFRIV
jgi:acylphosphatase